MAITNTPKRLPLGAFSYGFASSTWDKHNLSAKPRVVNFLKVGFGRASNLHLTNTLKRPLAFLQGVALIKLRQAQPQRKTTCREFESFLLCATRASRVRLYYTFILLFVAEFVAKSNPPHRFGREGFRHSTLPRMAMAPVRYFRGDTWYFSLNNLLK